MTIPQPRHYGEAAPVIALRRYDTLGPIEVLARSDNYLMVRRPPSAHPFVMTRENYTMLALTPEEALAVGLQVHWGVPEPSFTRPAYEPLPAGANARPHPAAAD